MRYTLEPRVGGASDVVLRGLIRIRTQAGLSNEQQ
jgi:hypothetical protein